MKRLDQERKELERKQRGAAARAREGLGKERKALQNAKRELDKAWTAIAEKEKWLSIRARELDSKAKAIQLTKQKLTRLF
jgi:hypothetical protein